MRKIKKLYYVWGIVVLAVFILLIIYGIVYKSKSYVYKELEQKLVNAEKKYVDVKFLYPIDDKVVTIPAKEMIENGFLDSTRVGDETCEGYVTIKKGNTVYEYKAYVKCKNYTTKGYKK